MKNYKVDFEANLITVSRKFAREASLDINGQAFAQMMKLRQLGMPIVIAAEKVRRTGSLSYEKMRHYISCRSDAAEYLKEFEAVRIVARSQKNPYSYVSKWFRDRFPNYSDVPTFNEDYLLVNASAPDAA